jgi:hypothetical protein
VHNEQPALVTVTTPIVRQQATRGARALPLRRPRHRPAAALSVSRVRLQPDPSDLAP